MAGKKGTGQRVMQNFKGTMQTVNSEKGFQNALALKSLDNDQKALVRALNHVIRGYALDLYGDESETKYRYIVDLIIKRVQDSLDSIGLEDSDSLPSIIKDAVEDAFDNMSNDKSLSKSDLNAVKNLLNKCSKSLVSDIKDKLAKKLQSVAASISGIKGLVSKIYNQQQKDNKQLKQISSRQSTADKHVQDVKKETVKKQNKQENKQLSSMFGGKSVENLNMIMSAVAGSVRRISEKLSLLCVSFERQMNTVPCNYSGHDSLFFGIEYLLHEQQSKMEDYVSKTQINTLNAMSHHICDNVEDAQDNVNRHTTSTTEKLKSAISGFAHGLQNMFSLIGKMIGGIVFVVKTVIAAAFTALKFAILFPLKILTFLVKGMFKIVSGIAKVILVPIKFLLKPVVAVVNLIFGMISRIFGFFSKLLNFIFSPLGLLVIGGFVVIFWKKIKKYILEFYNDHVKKYYLEYIKPVVDYVSPILKKIKDVFLWKGEQTWKGIKEAVAYIRESVKPYIEVAKGIFADQQKTFWEKIKDTFKAWYEMMFPNGIQQAIVDFWNYVILQKAHEYYPKIRDKYLVPFFDFIIGQFNKYYPEIRDRYLIPFWNDTIIPFWNNTLQPFLKDKVWPLFKNWVKNNWKELLAAFGLAYLISNPFQAINLALGIGVKSVQAAQYLAKVPQAAHAIAKVLVGIGLYGWLALIVIAAAGALFLWMYSKFQDSVKDLQTVCDDILGKIKKDAQDGLDYQQEIRGKIYNLDKVQRQSLQKLGVLIGNVKSVVDDDGRIVSASRISSEMDARYVEATKKLSNDILQDSVDLAIEKGDWNSAFSSENYKQFAKSVSKINGYIQQAMGFVKEYGKDQDNLKIDPDAFKKSEIALADLRQIRYDVGNRISNIAKKFKDGNTINTFDWTPTLRDITQKTVKDINDIMHEVMVYKLPKSIDTEENRRRLELHAGNVVNKITTRVDATVEKGDVEEYKAMLSGDTMEIYAASHLKDLQLKTKGVTKSINQLLDKFDFARNLTDEDKKARAEIVDVIQVLQRAYGAGGFIKTSDAAQVISDRMADYQKQYDDLFQEIQKESAKGKDKANQEKIRDLYARRAELDKKLEPLKKILKFIEENAKDGELLGTTARKQPTVSVAQVNIINGNPAGTESGSNS